METTQSSLLRASSGWIKSSLYSFYEMPEITPQKKKNILQISEVQCWRPLKPKNFGQYVQWFKKWVTGFVQFFSVQKFQAIAIMCVMSY